MHTVKNFVGVGADEDPEVFIEEVVARVQQENWLNSAREYAARHTETQPQADRLVQEIVIREDFYEMPWILEKLPLIEPEVDHAQIGEHRVSVSSDEDQVHIEIQIRAVAELNQDGTITPGWLVYDEMDVDKRFWDRFRGAVLYTGPADGMFMDPDPEEHIDDQIHS